MLHQSFTASSVEGVAGAHPRTGRYRDRRALGGERPFRSGPAGAPPMESPLVDADYSARSFRLQPRSPRFHAWFSLLEGRYSAVPIAALGTKNWGFLLCSCISRPLHTWLIRARGQTPKSSLEVKTKVHENILLVFFCQILSILLKKNLASQLEFGFPFLED